jgi:hypothetical protein
MQRWVFVYGKGTTQERVPSEIWSPLDSTWIGTRYEHQASGYPLDLFACKGWLVTQVLTPLLKYLRPSVLARRILVPINNR